jgi:hypothetical protein
MFLIVTVTPFRPLIASIDMFAFGAGGGGVVPPVIVTVFVGEKLLLAL